MIKLIGIGITLLIFVISSGCSISPAKKNIPDSPSRDETPISSPIEIPVSTPMEEVSHPPADTYLSAEEVAQYTSSVGNGWNRLIYPMLPGFSIDFPSSWSIQIKPMQKRDQTDPQWSLKPQSQMRITLNQNEVELRMVALLAWDDNGGMKCSNTIPFQKIGEGWYRYQDSAGTSYTHHGYTNYTTGDQPSLFSGSSGEWEYQTSTQYAFCEDGGGIWILSGPPDELSTDDDGLLMLEPNVVGQPTSEQLADMDAIVKSIKNECVTDPCVFSTW